MCCICVDQSYFQLTAMQLLKRTLSLRHLLLICCHHHSAVALSSCRHRAPLDCSQNISSILRAVPGCSIYFCLWCGCRLMSSYLQVFGCIVDQYYLCHPTNSLSTLALLSTHQPEALVTSAAKVPSLVLPCRA